MFYYQLGVTAYLQLICFKEVGEVESGDDNFVLGLAIGGLKSKSEGVFCIYPVPGGQDQPRRRIISRWGGLVPIR